jgi:hypothetical protein
MYYKLPTQCRVGLVWNPYGKQPMSLAAARLEIINDTKLSKRTLKKMGFTDE